MKDLYGEKAWQELHKNATKQQLYGHLPPIKKTIQVRWSRHVGYCWWSRDELISSLLLWTPSHGRAKAGRPARTYIQQLRDDTRCSPEDMPEAMDDREGWRERVRDIRVDGPTWWWWWRICIIVTNKNLWQSCQEELRLILHKKECTTQ